MFTCSALYHSRLSKAVLKQRDVDQSTEASAQKKIIHCMYQPAGKLQITQPEPRTHSRMGFILAITI